MRKYIFSIALVLVLSACVKKPDNKHYDANEVGASRAIEFGTVLSVREVEISAKKEESTIGGLLGAGVGAGGGSYVGKGSGSGWATAGGAVAGAVIGSLIADEIMSSKGNEYVLYMRNGDTKTIVQEQKKENPVFKPGDKVMLQYCDAGNEHVKRCPSGANFQRLFPVDAFPPEPEKKKRSHKKKSGDIPDDFSPDH